MAEFASFLAGFPLPEGCAARALAQLGDFASNPKAEVTRSQVEAFRQELRDSGVDEQTLEMIMVTAKERLLREIDCFDPLTCTALLLRLSTYGVAPSVLDACNQANAAKVGEKVDAYTPVLGLMAEGTKQAGKNDSGPVFKALITYFLDMVRPDAAVTEEAASALSAAEAATANAQVHSTMVAVAQRIRELEPTWTPGASTSQVRQVVEPSPRSTRYVATGSQRRAAKRATRRYGPIEVTMLQTPK